MVQSVHKQTGEAIAREESKEQAVALEDGGE